MWGAISILAGVGVICAVGTGISSGLRFFLSYDYDLNKKINESNKKKKDREKETGGENHDLHMARLSGKINSK